ncbi:MAG: peptidoglycan recognition family protein [Parafannyhessea umbonata]|uniref:peptidoglycan recognition protein family protein n=1 Tax=Parafannyhessea umbonata TaxID=604330 RepID=UPI0026EA6035|nr:peptidoglycan recognition family protein [Parafannyhessea umbonata]MDD6566428.1 peptidoglycan recognition family protein [Parafannyhessea umbonata]
MGYSIQSIPASSRTYTRGREGCSIGHIVVHYTGAAGGAVDNGRYFAGGARGASAHYFVDSGAIVQSVADSDTAWAVGNWGANLRTLSIEVCSAGEDFSQGERERLRWLVRSLMARHGVDAAHVIRHYDCYDAYRNIGGRWVDPHKCCPAPYAPNGGDPSGAKWRELHEYITNGGESEEDMNASDVNDIWAFTNGGESQTVYRNLIDNNVRLQALEYAVGDRSGANGDMYTNVIDTNVRIQEVQATLAALSAAVQALATSKGADPDAIAQEVKDAVAQKLSEIKLSVSTEAAPVAEKAESDAS